jgi:DNA-binding PadR family transcriptional regulator
MLELAILGLLEELPLHGYELKKRLKDSLGDVWGVSYGSLYPALARLEKVGAIEVVDPAPAPAAAIPATGSISGEAAAARLRRLARPSGRTRKAYRIAPRGHDLFAEMLRADPAPGADEERDFALKLAFCRHLDPPARLELLQRRRAQLAERLARGQEAVAARAARGRVRDRYAQALLEHGTRSTERDLEWLDQLIEDEHREGSKV